MPRLDESFEKIVAKIEKWYLKFDPTNLSLLFETF